MSRATIAKVLMLLLAVSALGAFAGGIGDVRAAPAATQFVEAWRTLGFLVFAGLFALLALYPRAIPGLWELTFLHKAGMALFAFLVAKNDPHAMVAGYIDLALAGVTAVSYFLAEGYRNWSSRA